MRKERRLRLRFEGDGTWGGEGSLRPRLEVHRTGGEGAWRSHQKDFRSGLASFKTWVARLKVFHIRCLAAGHEDSWRLCLGWPPPGSRSRECDGEGMWGEARWGKEGEGCSWRGNQPNLLITTLIDATELLPCITEISEDLGQVSANSWSAAIVLSSSSQLAAGGWNDNRRVLFFYPTSCLNLSDTYSTCMPDMQGWSNLLTGQHCSPEPGVMLWLQELWTE
jgi:hypothetical protein